MIRELWPGCKIIHGKPRHPESLGLVERVNREIKKVLGSLMRKVNDPCWVTYVPLAQSTQALTQLWIIELHTEYTIKTQLTCIYMCTSALRLIGRFTTCLAQTTSASRLLFASNWHLCPKLRKKRIFSIFKIFPNFVPS